MNNKFFIIIILFITISGLVILLINNINPSTRDHSLKLKIAGTIFPVSDILTNIAGKNIEVINILPGGASPHTYEPTISDIEKLDNIDIVFTIGLGVDDWVLDLIEEQNVKIITLSDNVELLESDHKNEEPSENENHQHHEFDPHIWMSIDNGIIIAEIIKDTLIEQYPDSQTIYEDNYNAYKNKLDSLKKNSQAKLSILENRKLITFHNAFSYLARDLDLEIATTIEPFPGKEPTASYLKEVGDILEKYKIKTLFKEPQLSENIVTALAEDYGIKVETLDPLGGVPGRMSFVKLITYNVDTIYKALK